MTAEFQASHAPEGEGQDVIYYDYSQANDQAAYLVVSGRAVPDAGIYDDVKTVQDHLDLVGQFAINVDCGEEEWATD